MAALYKAQGDESVAIAGRILPSSDLDFNCYLRFAYSGVAHSKGGARGWLRFMHFCSSFIAVERDAFLQLGGFNELLLRYEDSDLGFMLQESGTRLIFPESIVAYHGEQMNREWFIDRCEFTGQYLKIFHLLHPTTIRWHHRFFYNRIFGCLSDRIARMAIGRLRIVESLPNWFSPSFAIRGQKTLFSSSFDSKVFTTFSSSVLRFVEAADQAGSS